MSAQIKINWYHVSLGIPRHIPSAYPWPDDTFIQAGGRGGIGAGNYDSYFVEAFPDTTYLRGEGETLQEAEKAAWNKYVAGLVCTEHEFETRGYTNGAAFCKNCNLFKGKHYTAEELGQFCYKCDAPCFDSVVLPTKRYSSKEEREEITVFVCPEHRQEHSEDRFLYLMSIPDNELNSGERADISMHKFMYLDDED